MKSFCMNLTKERFAVIGRPVLHSKSPVIFNSWFQFYRINAHYNCIAFVGQISVHDIFNTIGLCFANVTTPFKEPFFRELQKRSAVAEMVEGINVVFKTSDSLWGDNTDGEGVIGALSEVSNDFACKSLVIGAGPAGRSAAYALKKQGSDVYITNRTIAKAENFARKIGAKVLPYASLTENLNEFKIIVNATLPEINPLEGAQLSPGTVILDANYGKRAQNTYSHNVKVIPGERWLIHQAKAGFEKYFGFKPELGIPEIAMKTHSGYNEYPVALVSIEKPEVTWENYQGIIIYNNVNENQAREWASYELSLITKQ